MSGKNSNPGKVSLRRKLAGDTGALFLVQGLGFLIPLATLPYLVRTLGTESFGVYGLAVAFSNFLLILLEYGFGISGTRRAVPILDNPTALSRLYWSIYGSKLILLFGSIIPIVICVFLVPQLKQCASLIATQCLGVVATTAFPLWLLQARGQLKKLAWILTLLKLSNFGFFIVVQGPDDLLNLGWFYFAQTTINALIGQFVALKGLTLKFPQNSWFTDSIAQIRLDFDMFASQIGSTLIANTTTVVLGSTSPPQYLGSFLIADRIMRAATALAAPASQAILPVSTSLFHMEAHANAIRFLRKYLFSAGTTFFSGCSLLYIFAPQVTALVSGDQNDLAIKCLRIMAFFPFITFLNNLLGPQILMHLNKERKILTSNITGCVVGLCLQPIIIPIFHALGASAAIILSEVMVTPFLLYNVAIHFYPNHLGQIKKASKDGK